MILRIGVVKAADGGDTHAVEVGASFCGVALEISVQRAFFLGHSKFVAGLGEMIPPAVFKACCSSIMAPNCLVAASTDA